MSEKAVEQPERDQRRRALAVRRQLADLDVPVGEAERLHPLRGMASKVFLAEPGGGRDLGRDRATVERIRPGGRDVAQGGAELGQAVDLAARRSGSGRAIGRRPVQGDTLGRCDPTLRRVDRGGERGVETQPAEAFREVGPRPHGARDGHRARPGFLDGRVLGELGGRASGAVQADQLPVPPELSEEVAADARVARLGNTEHRCSRERGIDGVAAALERSDAGTRRERMARGHHRLSEDRRPSHER